MSLTFPAAYSAALKGSSVIETWYAKLYYGDETNFIGITNYDLTISSIQYYGIVISWGEINEMIDLARSQASISDVTIECMNEFKGAKLTDEIFGGSNKYINRKVLIYSYINSTSVQIFQGVLTNIQSDMNRVTLTIEAKHPWSDITIPSDRNTDNFLEPLAYGDYKINAIADDDKESFGRPVDSKLYPTPFNKRYGDGYTADEKIWHMINNRTVSGENSHLHYYEQGSDSFYRIVDPSSQISSTVVNGATSIHYTRYLKRTFLLRPISYDSVYTTFGNVGGLIGNYPDAYDWEEDGFVSGSAVESDEVTEHNGSLPTGNQTVENLVVYLPKIQGKVTDLVLYYKIEIECTAQTLNDASSQSVTITDETWSNGSTIEQWTELDGVGSVYTSDELDGINDDYSKISHTAALSGQGYTLPEYINIQVDWLATYNAGSGDQFTANVKIFDVYALISVELDWTSQDFDALTNKIEDLTELYASSDGMYKSYSGGSGVAKYPHEIHRDLLARFTDFDFADGSFPQWSAITTARGSASSQEWHMRWWTLEQVALIDVLNRIQYEGCFIFKPRVDADGGRHIWVKDNPTGDLVHTLSTEDYADLTIGITDFSELVTDWTYNYNRHPAKSTYIQTATYSNTASRNTSTGWIKTSSNDNKVTVNLEMLVNCGDNTNSIYDTGSSDGDNAPNESIVMYYDNILADPKIIISCNIINKLKSNLEVGDIIQFTNSDITPFSKAWADLYFMIIETVRSVNSLSIKAREVYETP